MNFSALSLTESQIPDWAFYFRKRDKDGYVQDAEGKRVPVVLQYSQFEQLKDKAKAIVEAHAKEASQKWNV